jgi:uncharacterized protein involved in type VI secretion and phage assembly
MMPDLTIELLGKTEKRFYGKYRAFVVDNADPENRGRLRLRIPGALGSDIVSGWALPCAPYGGTAGQGFFYIPDKEAGVWAEFEEGDLDYPVWVGTFWAKPGGTTEVPDPANNQSPPTSKIIKTKNHAIELADADGSEAIKLTDSKNNNTVVIDSKGIAFQDTNSNKVTMDSNGITVQDSNGNKVTLASGSMTLASQQIKIGENASAEKMVLGTTLKTLLTVFAQHTHVGNLGAPTGPPVPPADFSSILSKHLVEQ